MKTHLHQQLLREAVKTRNTRRERCNSHVDMPAHHIGFLRYVKDSDACEYADVSAAWLRPCIDEGRWGRVERSQNETPWEGEDPDLFGEDEARADGKRAGNS